MFFFSEMVSTSYVVSEQPGRQAHSIPISSFVLKNGVPSGGWMLNRNSEEEEEQKKVNHPIDPSITHPPLNLRKHEMSLRPQFRSVTPLTLGRSG